ncbi:hypothetical protein VNO80_33119 [Phaseolus coccineus]|uniref:Cytochrome c oxidase subunit 3 n=1 Tax=Phaseolus coccineus TaxID=3886 RepID=A0AAN9Q989_PHACN
MIESQRHSYHLVDPSPWPISGSLGALATTVGGVMYMHSFQGGATLLSLGLIFILYTMFVWWRDVLRESTLEGHHTKVVQLGPRYGSIPFIVSEVMFLFAFFRASSHSSLAPTVEIGGIWPPLGIWVLDPWEIPFLNTPILLSSGAAVTWAHHAILAGKEKRAVYALVATVSLALVFTGFQGMEYYQAPFTISDSIYGSTFFLATGFHGFHVIIGTLFLIICGIRQYLGHLTKEHHVGFEAAAWYWHFVDVVRLFLFVSIYWWGERLTLPPLLAQSVRQGCGFAVTRSSLLPQMAPTSCGQRGRQLKLVGFRSDICLPESINRAFIGRGEDKMPSRRGFFHHINQAQSPNSNNQSGRNGAYTRSMESTAGTGIGFGRQLFCYWWHMVPVYGTGQRTNRRGRDRSIGSDPVLDLSNGTGTGEAIGLIGRVSPTGMWSSRSYLRKD